MSESVNVVVEIGPHSTLSGPVRQIFKGRKHTYLSCLKRQVNAVDTMQDVACELLSLGYPVLLSAVNPRAQPPKFVSNLPTYAWNHGTRYWIESRVNKDIRQKRFPPHELLGLPVSGSTTLVAEWRNFLRLADVPWLADHQVDDQVVLPGAAYISMAVEAARLLAEESGLRSQGYRIRHAEFLSALTIPESDTVEVRLRMQPVNSAFSYDFQIGSLGTSGAWEENCRGQIAIVEVQDTSKPPNIDGFLDVGETIRDIDAAYLVARIGEMGVSYGPSFQNLTYGRVASSKAVTNLRISRVASQSDTYLVHPTTLDCVIQSAYSALSDETGKEYIVLPKFVQSMYIPSHMNRQAGDELHVFTELQSSQKKGFTSTVEVANAGGGATLSPLRIGKLFCQAVPRGIKAASSDEGTGISLYTSVWEPDILYNIPENRRNSMRITTIDEEVEFEKRVMRASYYFISDAISQLEKENKDSWEEHHKLMFDWMAAVLARGKKGAFGPGSKMWPRATRGMKQGLFDELGRRDISCQLLVRVGAQLANMLRGRISSQELVDASSLQTYFLELPILKSRSFKHAASIVEMFAVKTPGANVLEIGGTTPSIARAILGAFGSRGGGTGTLLGRYTFISGSLDQLNAARQQLSDWEGLVDFENIDFEQDHIGQSRAFGEKTFDLIVASMLSHTTKDIKQTLTHIRKLLNPGGKLLLLEVAPDRLDVHLVLGTLPGWWSSDKLGRSRGAEIWDSVLRDTGFTGLDFDIEDCENGQVQHSKVILSSAAAQPVLASAVTIVYTTPVPEEWNTQLIETINQQTGIVAKAESWDEVQPENKVYIFTGDMASSFIGDMDRASFLRLQQFFVRSRGILWVSCGGAIDAQSPTHAMAQGFLRTLRHEDTSKRLIHLDFEQNSGGHWAPDTIGHIVHVFQETMDESRALEDVDWEYAVKGNVLHVPRVFPNTTIMAAPEPSKQPFHQPAGRHVWQSSESVFAADTQIGVGLPVGVVEIEVRAFDAQPQPSTSDDEDTSGYDFAGVVLEAGPSSEESGLQPGDRVAGLAQGSFASKVRVHWTQVVKIPDKMSFADAACVPIAYATAYHALVDVARLKQGESVLIHHVKYHESQAAIAVAQHIGAHVFATVESGLERSVLMGKWGVPSDRIFSLQDTGIATNLKLATQRKGVDVVLSSSGQDFESLEDCIAWSGRVIETGSPDAPPGSGPWSMASSRRHCATYARLDIMEVAKYNRSVFWEAMKVGFRICHTMKDSPTTLFPVMQYPISRMDEALRYRRRKEFVTKVIAVANPKELVKVSEL